MQRNLYLYTYLDSPWEQVEPLLHDDPAGLLQEATTSAGERTRQVSVELRVDVGSFQVGRDATVELGELRQVDAHCVSLPVRWESEDHHGLFPAMEGFLEAAQLANHPPVTQLSFIGTYRPPLGVLGVLGDAGVGHRVAEMAVHHFLMDVAARIEAATPATAPA